MMPCCPFFQAAWLLKAVTFIDLTTLSGDDTPSNVQRLCLKAIQPVRCDLLKKMDMQRKGLRLTCSFHSNAPLLPLDVLYWSPSVDILDYMSS